MNWREHKPDYLRSQIPTMDGAKFRSQLPSAWTNSTSIFNSIHVVVDPKQGGAWRQRLTGRPGPRGPRIGTAPRDRPDALPSRFWHVLCSRCTPPSSCLTKKIPKSIYLHVRKKISIYSYFFYFHRRISPSHTTRHRCPTGSGRPHLSLSLVRCAHVDADVGGCISGTGISTAALRGSTVKNRLPLVLKISSQN